MTEPSIELPAQNACPFCDYLSGARPYVFLWRESGVAVAVTREQRGVSHLLVFPTEHVETLLQLKDSSAEPLMVALRDSALAINGAEERPGIAVWQNNGVPAGQAVAHLHFHVAGTLAEGGTEFGPVEEITLDQARTIAVRLAPHVPKALQAGREILPQRENHGRV
jgi:histidine triad (HIT) family protein